MIGVNLPRGVLADERHQRMNAVLRARGDVVDDVKADGDVSDLSVVVVAGDARRK